MSPSPRSSMSCNSSSTLGTIPAPSPSFSRFAFFPLCWAASAPAEEARTIIACAALTRKGTGRKAVGFQRSAIAWPFSLSRKKTARCPNCASSVLRSLPTRSVARRLGQSAAADRESRFLKPVRPSPLCAESSREALFAKCSNTSYSSSAAVNARSTACVAAPAALVTSASPSAGGVEMVVCAGAPPIARAALMSASVALASLMSLRPVTRAGLPPSVSSPPPGSIEGITAKTAGEAVAGARAQQREATSIPPAARVRALSSSRTSGCGPADFSRARAAAAAARAEAARAPERHVSGSSTLRGVLSGPDSQSVCAIVARSRKKAVVAERGGA
mmetsp:Transcript_17455/g.44683  ORF Transcript_17455/g.44683 Transcript_17455/m.44683 type:complete len:332 (-) Transcript_17455:1647-2642(-)